MPRVQRNKMPIRAARAVALAILVALAGEATSQVNNQPANPKQPAVGMPPVMAKQPPDKQLNNQPQPVQQQNPMDEKKGKKG